MKSKLLIVNDVPEPNSPTVSSNNDILMNFKTYMNNRFHNICDIHSIALLNDCRANSKDFLDELIKKVKECDAVVVYDCCSNGTPSRVATYIIKAAEKLDKKVVLMNRKIDTLLAAIDEIGGFLTLKSGKSDIFKIPSDRKLLAWGLEAIRNSGALADIHCCCGYDSDDNFGDMRGFFTDHLFKHFKED